MLNLRFTAGVRVGISGACGPPLVWRARKPLPSAFRSSVALALGLARQRAPVPEHRLPVLGLCLRPQWMQTSLLFSSSLLFLLVCVALKLRSLRFHSPCLCRIAVFSIQTNVSLSHAGDPPFSLWRRSLSLENLNEWLLQRPQTSPGLGSMSPVDVDLSICALCLCFVSFFCCPKLVYPIIPSCSLIKSHTRSKCCIAAPMCIAGFCISAAA